MWIRHQEQKHVTFDAAHTARVAWLNDNPNTDAGERTPSKAEKSPAFKCRVQARAGTFKFVVWKRDEKGAK